MTLVRAVCVVALLVLPAALFAATTNDFGVCNPATVDWRNHLDLLTEKDIFTEYQTRLRSVDFSSYEAFRASVTEAELDLPLAEGFLGLNGSHAENAREFQTKYKEFMSSTYEQMVVRERFKLKRDEVSSVLVKGWNRCFEIVSDTLLRQNGTFIKASPIGGFDAFTVSVSNRSPEGGKHVQIKAIEPAQYVRCYRKGELVALDIDLPSTDFDLTCQKDANREVGVSIETNMGKSQIVKLPAQTSKLADIESQLKRTLAEMEVLRGELTKAKVEQAEANKKQTDAIDSWKIATVGTLYGPGAPYAPPQSAPSWRLLEVFAASGDKQYDVTCPQTAPFMTGLYTFGNGHFVLRCRA